MKSLYKIRSYFKQNNDLESTNEKAMLTHAICFGIYLVITTIYGVWVNIQIYLPNEPVIYFILVIIGTVYFIATSISLVILCYIFLVLMTTQPDDIIETIVVEDFDEDADLNARIWNMLV